MGNVLKESVTNVTNDSESDERNLKEQEYYAYVQEHVNNVKKAFEQLFIPLLDKTITPVSFSEKELKDAIIICKDTTIPEHDASKYYDEEFEGYRMRWYPTASERANPDFDEIVIPIYRKSWQHHYTHNMHHPFYWVDENGAPIDMNLESIVEMICDWEAMSMKFGGNTVSWYHKDAKEEKAAMTSRTKEIAEELFTIIY